MRRSKRSAEAANEEESDELLPEADDHLHHHDDGDDHQHHNQADDHHHHEGVNAEDPWSWIRLQGTNRSRRDVRYVPKFIETALVLDKAMVHTTQGIKSNQGLTIFSKFQFVNRAGLSRRDVIHEAIQVPFANKKMLITRFA